MDDHASFEDDFSDQYDGTIAPERAREFAAHLATCNDCRAEYAFFKEAMAAVALLHHTPAASPAPRAAPFDEDAFRELVEAHQDQVFHVIFRMMGSRTEAEDVAQEVFVTVFKSFDQFRGEAKFSTWLYRVAVNHCKNRIRYLSRRSDRKTTAFDDAVERRVEADGGQPIGAAQILAPDRALEGAQTERMVQEAIADLEEDHREMIVLRDIEEMSYEEIGQITGLAEGTVKSRLHRARLALKAKLARQL